MFCCRYGWNKKYVDKNDCYIKLWFYSVNWFICAFFHWLYYLREDEDLNNHLSVSATIGLKLGEVPFGIDLKTTLPLSLRSRKNRTETIDCNLLLAVVFISILTNFEIRTRHADLPYRPVLQSAGRIKVK